MSQNNTSLTAQWSYKAKHCDELNVKKHDVVTFIRKDANNKDWLVVSNWHGTTGRVPGTHFRLAKSPTINDGQSTDSCNKSNKCKTGDTSITFKDAKSLQRIDTRTRIMQEIIQTETQYNKKLAILVDKYKKPLEARLNKHPILDKEEINLLFKSIPIILTMSTAFLTGLKQANYKNIGKLFIGFATCLRAYSPYLSSYMAGIYTLQALQKDKSRKSKWLEFLAERPHNLDQLLIEPAQRIPRYELLLKELDKHTEEEHPEKPDIKRARDEVHASALQNDRDIASNDFLQWQYRPAGKDTWTSMSDRVSSILNRSKLQKKTCIRMFSKDKSWEVDLKAMTRRLEGKGIKQSLRVVLRDEPAKPLAPAEPVLTSPSLVQHIRTTTDGSRLRVRVPGTGWVPLREKQLKDILLPRPKYFYRAGNKGKWLYIPSDPNAKHCDIGVLKSDDPRENVSVSRSNNGHGLSTNKLKRRSRSFSALPKPMLPKTPPSISHSHSLPAPNKHGALPPPLPPKLPPPPLPKLPPTPPPPPPKKSTSWKRKGSRTATSRPSSPSLSKKEKKRILATFLRRRVRSQMPMEGRPDTGPPPLPAFNKSLRC